MVGVGFTPKVVYSEFFVSETILILEGSMLNFFLSELDRLQLQPWTCNTAAHPPPQSRQDIQPIGEPLPTEHPSDDESARLDQVGLHSLGR